MAFKDNAFAKARRVGQGLFSLPGKTKGRRNYACLLYSAV
jgi:hypothetical protein